ncbi:HAD-IC family P-type ATPase [Candidatus Parcubacteria bacterium]|nr:HAD-IC family P-type ATPase [Candidatus Parcubacteria bacterium]
MEFFTYSNASARDVLAGLKTSKEGLSKKEVLLRQRQYGLNEVRQKGVNIFDILLRQIKSPFFYLLVVASSLLKNFIPEKVKVVRAGKQEIIEKKELVVGDIVDLSSGNVVPAELRVIEAPQDLLVDESLLTGESVPVMKISEALKNPEKEIFRSHNILFTGTSVISGKVQGVVIGTGENTALGKIMKLSVVKRPESAYQKDLIYFCRLILRIVVVTIILIFLLNVLIKGTSDIFNFALFAVALIVSILPEALPTVVVLALSGGSLRMAKENVVVKRLSAIEDLGNIEILCTDKTGTITQNKLSLEKIISSNREKTMLYGLLGADEPGKVLNNVSYFDSAIFQRADYRTMRDLKKFTVLQELAFDSFRMRQSFLVKDRSGKKVMIAKGSPDVILGRCSKFPGGQKRSEIKAAISSEGRDGKRVLAIAYKAMTKEIISKSDESDLTFLGYAVFEDALKSTSQEAIKLAKKLGVQIKVITGDAKEVAGFVAHKTGLVQSAEDVVLGEELENMHQQEFDNACQDHNVFARVSPEIKYRIIKSLQKRYEVGFLGEGINDVPALKIANVAIAVSEATDVAKEAADIVLLQKDLRVIINGIKDGRSIFSNINKYIRATLTSNFGNFYAVAGISLFIPFLPMLPVQILLANLLTDFPLISIVTDSVDIEELRKPKMYQLHNILPLIISLGLVSTLFDFIFFFIFYKTAPGNIQTLWFIESILTELLLIFIIRTRHVFWKAKKPSVSLIWLTVVAAIVSLALPLTIFGKEFFHFSNVSLFGLFTVIVLVGVYIAVSELVKLIYFHYFKVTKNSFEVTERNNA